ncbi:SMC-Scp complex subunit ScpB [Angustibacter sp. Root456]|uniref:SMC-Scp complex subunit ScpB n=1 Tax=Angustibacter sp. Root456 TaxID=1736539 RepID=UPI0006F2B19D|nr:SMC-Scp complex subunit ScpB [Angustibacter sp. Root456]KQX66473.1 segregation and condensation protein B [Angustibacter sp. Root456]
MSEQPQADAPQPPGDASSDDVAADLTAVDADALDADAVDADAVDADALDLDALPSGAKGAVEAVLMVVEEPVTELALAEALALPPQQVADLLRELAAEYDQGGRGFELREVAGGWRVFSRADYAPVVERFVVGGQQARLTQAALETLAVVAYRQPVSRARVSAVRGVNVDGVMRTLVARGLVQEQGTDHESGAILYSTTGYFLERLGLTSVDELPALAPYLPEIDVLDELSEGASL